MDRYYGLPVSGADLAWALASIAGLHRKPFDAELLLQQFAPPYSVASLVAAAHELDFNAHIDSVDLNKLARTDLLCIAVLIAAEDTAQPEAGNTEQRSSEQRKSESAEPNESSPALTGELVLLTSVDGERVQYFSRTSQVPEIVPRTQFDKRFTG